MSFENLNLIIFGINLRYSFDLDKDDLADQQLSARSFSKMIEGLLDSFP